MLEFNNEIKEPNDKILEVEKKESSQINLKFITYRQMAESNERKLKEANSVIDQLKEEKAIWEEIEKNLRSQILSSQNRLIQMHDILKNMTIIQEKQRENDNKYLQIQTKIEELNEMINNIRERSNFIFEKTEKDLNLVAKINELNNKLKAKGLDYDLIKIELQSLQKEKKEWEAEVQKSKALEIEVEKSKKEMLELKTLWESTLLIYKDQIAYNEEIIRGYETERKTLLDEFDLPKDKIIVKNNFNGFTWADSTVNINWEKSETSEIQTNNSHFEETEMKSQPTPTQLTKENNFATSVSSVSSKSKYDDDKKEVEKFGENKKSQNQILDLPTPSAQQENSSCIIPPKRKLYSTNCNHYFI